MNKNAKFYASFALSLALLFSFSPARGQTLTETFELARQQEQLGNHHAAIRHYQRVVCFAQPAVQQKCYAPLARNYRALGDFQRAYSYFDLAYRLAPTDSLRKELLFGKTGVLLVEGKYNLALAEVLDEQGFQSPYFAARRKLYLGMTYFLLENFERSQIYIDSLAAEMCPEARASVDSIFDKVQHEYRKTPRKAKLWSMFVPGAGQIYAGDMKNGVNSFVLNVLLLGVTVYIGFRYGALNAIFSTAPWLFRYYRGGLKHAQNIARQRQKHHQQQNWQALQKTLQECMEKGF